MRAYQLVPAVLGLVGLLTGCSGGGSPWQPSAAAPNAARVPQVAGGRSWILPEARKNDLLYISDLTAQVVDIYTYTGHKLVGTLTGFFNPEGLCVDKAGDVYVTNDTSDGVHQISEYAHGSTTVLRVINDADGRANGCSVDPKTGDLAVANFWGPTEREGNVAIYPHASGSPTTYSNPNIYYYYYCSYDNHGNLFADGETYGSVFGLGERVAGGKAMKFIPVDQTIYLPGGVQWDGKYLAVGDQVAVKHNFTSTIYDFEIKGKSAKTVSTMILTGSNEVAQFWIPFVDTGGHHGQAKRIIGPNQNGADTLIWDYPNGTSPIQTISGETDPIGATVSLAKK